MEGMEAAAAAAAATASSHVQPDRHSMHKVTLR